MTIFSLFSVGNSFFRDKANAPIVAITAVITITTTAKLTNKFEYGSPYWAGKVAKTAAAKPRVNIRVIICRSVCKELFNVVINTAPNKLDIFSPISPQDNFEIKLVYGVRTRTQLVSFLSVIGSVTVTGLLSYGVSQLKGG